MRGASFSEVVKAEIASSPFGSEEERRAELLGFLKCKGSYNIQSGRVRISVGSLPAARRLVSLLRSFREVSSLEVSERDLDSRKRIEIEIPPREDWRSIMDSRSIVEEVSKDPVVLGSFLRGMFLAGGSVTDPRRHYHLEIVTFDHELLEDLRDRLERVFGVSGRVVRLRYNNRLYFKRSGDILEILHILGAHRAAADMERVMRERQAKGDANRSYNFISANAVRSGTSIAKQIEAIRKIEEKIGLEVLPEDLRRVAKARMENEDLSLRELGEILSMSKMMVYSRLRKIMRIAEGLE